MQRVTRNRLLSQSRGRWVPDGRATAAATGPSLPLSWQLAVGAMIATFYIANIYDLSISAQLYYLKWLAVLPVILFSWMVNDPKVAPGARAKPPLLPAIIIGSVAFLSVLDSRSVSSSAAFFVSLILGLVAAYSMSWAIAKTGGHRQFFNVIAIIGRLVIASAAVMWSFDLSLGRGHDRFSAWTDNPNTLALLLAPALVILTAEILLRRHGWLWLSVPFLLMGAALIWATGSRAGLLWVLASGLAFYFFRKGIGLTLVLSLAALILGFEFQDEILSSVLNLVSRGNASEGADLLSGRSEVWSWGVQLFAERPLLGQGFGMSQTLMDENNWRFEEAQGRHFHNSYLTAAVEMGIIGLIALVFVAGRAMVIGARGSFQRLTPDWPMRALPWAMSLGAFVHAFFETWLLSAGNANMIILWTCLLLLSSQSGRPASAQMKPIRRSVPGGSSGQ